ncbi:hypothetical protein ACFQDF_08460 [Ectobacillus funiculus]
MMTGECKRLAAASLRGKWNFGAGVIFLSQLILSIGSCALYLPFMIAALYAVHTFRGGYGWAAVWYICSSFLDFFGNHHNGPPEALPLSSTAGAGDSRFAV